MNIYRTFAERALLYFTIHSEYVMRKALDMGCMLNHSLLECLEVILFPTVTGTCTTEHLWHHIYILLIQDLGKKVHQVLVVHRPRIYVVNLSMARDRMEALPIGL